MKWPKPNEVLSLFLWTPEGGPAFRRSRGQIRLAWPPARTGSSPGDTSRTFLHPEDMDAGYLPLLLDSVWRGSGWRLLTWTLPLPPKGEKVAVNPPTYQQWYKCVPTFIYPFINDWLWHYNDTVQKFLQTQFKSKKTQSLLTLVKKRIHLLP